MFDLVSIATRCFLEVRRRLCLVAALISVASYGCAAVPETQVLHVATLNIAHGRGLAPSQLVLRRATIEDNLDAIAAAVRREKPAVLALQEADAPSTWSGSFDHVQHLTNAAEYADSFHGLHCAVEAADLHLQYGTALVADRPLASPAAHRFSGGLPAVKGFVTAGIEFGGRRLIIASLHLNHMSAKIRRKQIAEIADVLSDARTPIVLMGDFNCEEDDQDDALALIAARLNLHTFTPDSADLMTFPSSDPRRRLDWILASPELEFVAYRVWPDRLSDHLAVAATLRWREPG